MNQAPVRWVCEQMQFGSCAMLQCCLITSAPNEIKSCLRIQRELRAGEGSQGTQRVVRIRPKMCNSSLKNSFLLKLS